MYRSLKAPFYPNLRLHSHHIVIPGSFFGFMVEFIIITLIINIIVLNIMKITDKNQPNGNY